MGDIIVSNDRSLLDIPMIHQFLSERSYWAKERSFEMVAASIEHSLCFGIYNKTGQQLAFARVVTDYTIFGWIMDVFVLEEFRGLGLGKRLMHEIIHHPQLKNIKRMGLGTNDAHGLYRQYGFTELKNPQNMMEMLRVQS